MLLHHLFPQGFPGAVDDGIVEGVNVVGFDVEWRPNGKQKRSFHTIPEGESAPVSVVQLSSEFATVVVNVFALGSSLQPQSSLHEACAAGAAVVQAVFENHKLLKAGLGCHEDLKRLRLTLPQCEFPNTTDLRVSSDLLFSAAKHRCSYFLDSVQR